MLPQIISAINWDLVGSGMTVIVLLFISAFFSASETAFTVVSRARLQTLETEGNKRAKMVNQLIAKKDQLVSATLLGNNIVNILASALTTSVLIGLFGDSGVVYATIIMTTLVIIFSEVLPKTYALNKAESFCLAVAPIIRGVLFLLTPLCIVTMQAVKIILSLFGIKLESGQLRITIEELRGAIELHKAPEEETDINDGIRHERNMLRSVLDLGEVTVGEVMTHRRVLEMLDADMPPEEIVRRALESPYTRLPLWQGNPDNIIGVLHAKALFRAVEKAKGDIATLDIRSIANPPRFIPENRTLFDQLQSFRELHEHFALVVDEYGTHLGIVTLEDILEDIVGEIADEHDMSMEGVKAEAGGNYIVDGTVTIRDFNREFDWRLPDDNYTTMAGLVIYETRRIPQIGQCFTFYDLRIEVMARQRNQITLLRVTPMKPTEEQS